jgi:hypothetical protein
LTAKRAAVFASFLADLRKRGAKITTRSSSPACSPSRGTTPLAGQIVYAPLTGQLKQQRQLEESGQGHRIVRPIKRKNEDGSVYDLTREWMNEALFYPFAPKRDLIDASSRIYDMNASAPVQNEGRLAEPKSYADS